MDKKSVALKRFSMNDAKDIENKNVFHKQQEQVLNWLVLLKPYI